MKKSGKENKSLVVDWKNGIYFIRSALRKEGKIIKMRDEFKGRIL